VLTSAHTFVGIDDNNNDIVKYFPHAFYMDVGKGMSGLLKEKNAVKVLDYKINSQYTEII